jgi:serine/threonine protein kinase
MHTPPPLAPPVNPSLGVKGGGCEPSESTRAEPDAAADKNSVARPFNEKEVFNAARQIVEVEGRMAYLREACGADEAAKRRILDLLRVHEEEQNFLESSLVDRQASTHEQVAEGPGSVIGPYQLLEQIGEGGFGVVYRAEQQSPVCRSVALKIIKPGMDTRQVLARFKAEQQALALMDHPNIARVLDAGATETGRPYFVMELVRGIPITDYCDQNNLAVHERLGLFVEVCQAVQHAHQKGIIHRDIKPSNVLVTGNDGRPVPKVIDFGVAKAIDSPLTQETLFTRFAEMVGTPLYMSPEQAEMTSLDIDTRSDIYSLGVLLYELLTGTTPFDKARLKEAAFDEIRRIIREEEPPKPSTRISTLGDARVAVAACRRAEPHRLSQLVRGELDWIVMKALEKDPNRRYETANAFALDIERYLADEPVLACPPSASYRFGKFARRNKTVLGVAGLVFAALVLTVAILAISNARIEKEKRQRDQALQEKEAALQEKDKALQDAKANWEAVEISEKALLAWEKLAAAHPSVPEYSNTLAVAKSNLKIARARVHFVTPWSDSDTWVQSGSELRQLDDALVGHVVLFGDSSWKDYDFEAEAETITRESELGLIFRATSPRNYLYAVIGAFGKQGQGILVHSEGGAAPIGYVAGQISRGRWYRLRVEARGNRFKMFLDGKLLVAVTFDRSPQGCLGLVTTAHSRFRNVKVTDPDGRVLIEGVESILPKPERARAATRNP